MTTNRPIQLSLTRDEVHALDGVVSPDVPGRDAEFAESLKRLGKAVDDAIVFAMGNPRRNEPILIMLVGLTAHDEAVLLSLIVGKLNAQQLLGASADSTKPLVGLLKAVTDEVVIRVLRRTKGQPV